MQIPQKQMQMLFLLRKNARATLTEMASELGLSVSRVHKLMHSLIGLQIKRTCCMSDFRIAGYPITVCFAVKAKDREVLLEGIGREHCINEIVRINNGHDFLIEANFKDMAELYDFSDKLKAFATGITEYHIVEEVFREKFMADRTKACRNA